MGQHSAGLIVLGRAEQRQLLLDFGISPCNQDEQDVIMQLMDDVDVLGTGLLDIVQVTALVQRVLEGLIEVQRKRDILKAMHLKFSRLEAYLLRQAFKALDEDGEGTLDTNEVDKAVLLMGWQVCPRLVSQLIIECDEDNSGNIDFGEFLCLMRRMDDELKAAEAAEDDQPAPNPPAPKTAKIGRRESTESTASSSAPQKIPTLAHADFGRPSAPPKISTTFVMTSPNPTKSVKSSKDGKVFIAGCDDAVKVGTVYGVGPKMSGRKGRGKVVKKSSALLQE